VVKVPWFELRPGMEIKQVTQRDLVYVKNSIATEQLIENISQLYKNTTDEVEVFVQVRSLS